ncbi:MAG: hypothetical protein II998_06980 [Clostridia bacterium]|nr:hypothetical protein [Clostridia bacterium]
MNIHIDFQKKKGKIKPMHGVGQAPIIGLNDEMFHYLADAGIPYSRLHDVGGAFGGNLFVDIPNIFRNFDADEKDASSYDFEFTDWLIARLYENNCTPVFRLGVTIENFHNVKAYRIFPPNDYDKWSSICEHIIKHYNEGWANGFYYGIKYWEIWNEPDNGRDNTENQMWHGTSEEYYKLYEVTAKHLKKQFGDTIMIGGYASCGFRHIFSNPEKFGLSCNKSDDALYAGARSAHFIDFFEGFFEYIKSHGVPIDFFSWHSYLSTEKTVMAANYLDKRLKEFGFCTLETHLNEWNNVCEDRSDPLAMHDIARAELGTSLAAAKSASMMCAMQNTKTQILCYYDARIGISDYAGMFNPITRKPFALYYAFKAFNELYKLGNQAECSGFAEGDIYSLAAYSGDKKAVLITNISNQDIHIKTNLDPELMVYVIDELHMLEKIDVDPLDFVASSGSVYLICNTLNDNVLSK